MAPPVLPPRGGGLSARPVAGLAARHPSREGVHTTWESGDRARPPPEREALPLRDSAGINRTSLGSNVPGIPGRLRTVRAHSDGIAHPSAASEAQASAVRTIARRGGGEHEPALGAAGAAGAADVVERGERHEDPEPEEPRLVEQRGPSAIALPSSSRSQPRNSSCMTSEQVQGLGHEAGQRVRHRRRPSPPARGRRAASAGAAGPTAGERRARRGRPGGARRPRSGSPGGTRSGPRSVPGSPTVPPSP